MSESAATRVFCKLLESHNSLTCAIVGSLRQKRGLPDRFISHRRWQGWVEFKAFNGVVDPLQERFIREFNKRKVGSAFIVWQSEPGQHWRLQWYDPDQKNWLHLYFDATNPQAFFDACEIASADLA